jgi:hypothetical protein
MVVVSTMCSESLASVGFFDARGIKAKSTFWLGVGGEVLSRLSKGQLAQRFMQLPLAG